MRNEQYNDTGASYTFGDLETQLDDLPTPENPTQASYVNIMRGDFREQTRTVENTVSGETSTRQPMSTKRKAGYIAAGVVALGLTIALVGKAIYNSSSKGVCPPVYMGITEIEQSE